MTRSRRIRYVGGGQALASALELARDVGFVVAPPPMAPGDLCMASLDATADDCRPSRPHAPARGHRVGRGRAADPLRMADLAPDLHRLVATDNRERLRDLEVMLRTMHDPNAWVPDLHFCNDHDSIRYVLSSTTEKPDLLAAVDRFFSGCDGLPPVRRSQLIQIAEELVTNAFFDAPIDASGTHVFHHLDRRQQAELGPSRTVEVTLWADEMRFGVSVCDSFGSLTVDEFRTSLERGFRRGEDQIRSAAGGAGLGLFSVYLAASQLTTAITPGKRTHVLALVDVPKRYAVVHGLNAFWG